MSLSLFLLAYLAGLLTVAAPCILPVLPFVLARGDAPFGRGGLPLLLGLALSFTAVASLAAVAGGWAVAANHYGRVAALGVLLLCGAALLSPALAERLAAPLVRFGARLSQRVERRLGAGASLLLGVATGLVWAPCAGPVLGLILTGAALRGPGVETSLLLLSYGLGAATALAAALLFGRRLLARLRPAWSDKLRRGLGAAVVASVLAIGLGLDTRFALPAGDGGLERRLIEVSGVAHAAEVPARETPALSPPLQALVDAPRPLNAPALRPEDLRGKVVLVNFWTYSCINCLRTLPWVRAWAEKYQDRGLVVIGVHTPEFAFERDPAKVRTALETLGVRYPVIADNDYGLWRALRNEAWPALYFIGADGRLRSRVLGEGGYAQSEQLIQQLLAQAGTPAALPLGAAGAPGTQAAPDEADLRSEETYVGYDKATNFSSPGGFSEDAPRLYHAAPSLWLNHWSLAGTWTVGGEFATLAEAPGSIRYRFHARDLHLVLAPPPAGTPVRLRVTIDGAAPGVDHGTDVDAEGWGLVRQDKLYQLVRQAGPVKDRTVQVEFLDPGVRAYAFTFG